MTTSEAQMRRISEARKAFATGEALKLRLAANVSQAEFARAVGSSPASVSLWESGQRTPGSDFALKCWSALATLRRAA